MPIPLIFLDGFQNCEVFWRNFWEVVEMEICSEENRNIYVKCSVIEKKTYESVTWTAGVEDIENCLCAGLVCLFGFILTDKDTPEVVSSCSRD